MSFKVLRAGFIFTAKDVTKMSRFYQDVLGFSLDAEFDDPPFVILERQGMRLSITKDGNIPEDMPDFTFKTEHKTHIRSTCLVLEVENCDEVRNELAEKGVSFRSETFRPPWGGARFYMEDPEGNMIEIEQLA